jgi:hypothetical protein
MWGSTDYALDWPAELLAGELAALSANSVRPMRGAEVAILLDHVHELRQHVPAAPLWRACAARSVPGMVSLR